MVHPMPQDKDLTLIDKDNSERLQDAGMYVFMDEVNAETIKPVVEWILFANHVAKRKKKELLLMICSEGGSVEHAFALIDVMRSSSIPIKTVGLGTIASSGLLIFLSGSRGRRILTPNTSILSHQYSAYSEGKHHELFSITKEFNLVNERMVEHYKETTGLDEATIKSQLLPSSDVWLSAEEAMSMGICDYISDLRK
jgi:ATP-dependent Clp protease protease subunit